MRRTARGLREVGPCWTIILRPLDARVGCGVSQIRKNHKQSRKHFSSAACRSTLLRAAPAALEEVAMPNVARSLLVTWLVVAPCVARAEGVVESPTSTAASPAVDEPYTGPPTLFRKAPTVGVYAGPTLAYSRIGEQRGVLIGLEACFLLDHTIAFGLAGNLWATETRGPPSASGATQNLDVMYGGAVFRYAFFTDFLVYPAAGALVGAGSGTLVPDTGEHVPRSNTDAFFVLEPQLSLHSNVTRWVRITFQAGYRLAAGVSRFGYDEGTYAGATLGGAVQFGRL